MKKLIVFSLLLAFVACSTVPITGRKQMNLLPESQLVGMSLTSYTQFLSQNPALPASNSQAAQVKQVGDRIARAATRYLRAQGAGDRVSGFKWEFNLVQSNEVNAWCMPGGKVVFYTGILPITQNIDGLAVVMGHEVAHAIARHGNERMSQGLMVEAGGMALDVALSQKSAQTRSLFAQAYGLGATVGAILPFSRMHESEADKLGLAFAAIAGYNVDEAAPFWQRMAKVGGGSRPPEFLSTHPDPQSRAKDILEYLPTAKAIGRKYKLE
jgi:predicted Zn-dependent protease